MPEDPIQDETGAHPDGTPQSHDPKTAPRQGRPRMLPVVVAAGALAAAAGGVLWWLDARRFESTDDAYIDTHVTQVAPQAPGQVTQVLVADNQPVRAGQRLVQLDDSTARTQLAQAKAAEAAAQSQIDQAKAQVVVDQAQVEMSEASTHGPMAQSAFADRDYQRYAEVKAASPDAVARQLFDQANTTQIANAGALLAAQKQVKSSRAQVAVARTVISAGLAQLNTARAQEAAALLQIQYARIVAPVDGHVASTQVAPGNYATLGQSLMSVVPDRLWVTANYKETQLKRMRVGQHVDLRVDAYPQVRFSGHVDSVQRGAGQAFALLPAQNATGNFVKVVQRVPVKIVFDGPLDPAHPLGPGMSVVPHVRID
jgi:membrane fusion protein (multidrug efflux system)